jgi:hypothetical protein
MQYDPVSGPGVFDWLRGGRRSVQKSRRTAAQTIGNDLESQGIVGYLGLADRVVESRVGCPMEIQTAPIHPSRCIELPTNLTHTRRAPVVQKDLELSWKIPYNIGLAQ